MYLTRFLFLTLFSICLATQTDAEWFVYTPPGSVNGQGILRDVLSRCDARGARTAYDASQTTYCHEATHMLNSRIRQVAGGTGNVNVSYVGGGKYCVLPEPRVTISQVFANVRKYREKFHANVFSTAREWEGEPLYILDELSAYINGSQAARELRCDDHGSLDRCVWCAEFADRLVETVQQRDPNYSHLAELRDLVAYQKNRIAEFGR